MRILIISLILLLNFSINLFSQNINRANPYSFLMETMSLRLDNNNDSIIAILKYKIKNDTVIHPWHYHQLACYNARIENYSNSFDYLYKALAAGVSLNDVLSDVDIELLHNQPEWEAINDTITSIYLRKYPNITNKKLSVKLWKMGIVDQRFRTLKNNFKLFESTKTSPEEEAIFNAHQKIVENNLTIIEKLVKDKKWPLYSEVGKEAGDAAFLIVQHSGDNKLTKRALKLITIAVEENEASKSSYAMMIDRYLMHKNKKQIYGTQYTARSKGQDENGKFIFGKHFLYPTEDEKNVNKRRTEMGMTSIEENSKRFAVKYQYHPEYENMSCKKLYKYLVEKSMK